MARAEDVEIQRPAAAPPVPARRLPAEAERDVLRGAAPEVPAPEIEGTLPRAARFLVRLLQALIKPVEAARVEGVSPAMRRHLRPVVAREGAGAAVPFRAAAAGRRNASGIAAFPCRPTLPRPSAGATIPITWKPASCRRCS